ncbi:MAG: signal peptidase II [Paracoccaceae bacterium]
MRTLTSIAFLTAAVDQISKFLVLWGLNLDQIRFYPVWPPFLQFRMAWNDGVNFGLFGSSSELGRWILIALALAISCWIALWARRERDNRRLQISGGLLIGGALGNVIDRVIFGAVADFLNMSLPGINNPFSFNLADVAVFFGAIGLVFFTQSHKTP